MTSFRVTATATSDNNLHYEDIYAQIVSLQSILAHQSVAVNMRAIPFVTVDGLLAISNIARLWYRWSGHKVVLLDLQPQVHGYLERMDLFTQCQEYLEQDRTLDEVARLDRKPNSERLLEMTSVPSDELENSTVVQEAVQRIRAILDASTTRDAQAVGQLCTMLSEIAQNVVHSFDQGYAIVQRYRTRGTSELVQNYRVVISVADLGIGIEKSLRRGRQTLLSESGQPLVSGSDYIIRALDLGVTSRNSPGGIGLHQVRQIVERWRGTLTIRSQRSRVQITPDGISCTDDLIDVPGTHVTIEVQGS